MFDVLMTAPYMIPFMERFSPVFKHYGINIIQPQVDERMEENALMAYAGKFDGAICGDDRYTARVIQACTPRLKVISKWGTGIDSIDKEACAAHSVKLLNTLNAFTLPVADSVLGYILAFARQQPWMDRAIKSGVWKKIPGRSLSECTLGVIGVGNIGKAVLRRARGFGMRLLGNDIIPIPRDFLLEKINIRRIGHIGPRMDIAGTGPPQNRPDQLPAADRHCRQWSCRPFCSTQAGGVRHRPPAAGTWQAAGRTCSRCQPLLAGRCSGRNE